MQALLVRQSARLLKQALSQTDERSKLEGEVIGGIDVIKCSAWEVRIPGCFVRSHISISCISTSILEAGLFLVYRHLLAAAVGTSHALVMEVAQPHWRNSPFMLGWCQTPAQHACVRRSSVARCQRL
jgi:hypothetical protein